MMSKFLIASLLLVAVGLSQGTPLYGAPVDVHARIEKLTYGKESGSSKYDLTACVNVSLQHEEATIVLRDHGSEINIPGEQTSDAKCYLFTDVVFPTDGDDVRYDLHLHQSGSFFGTLGKVNYTFEHVNSVGSLNCAGVAYSRIVYASSHKAGANETCLTKPANTCYRYGTAQVSGTSGSLCLPATNNRNGEGLVVCQPGTQTNATEGKMHSPALNYDGYVQFTQATNAAAVTTETILSVNGNASVQSVDNNHVLVPKFKPSTNLYTVCAVQTTASNTVSRVDSAVIQDLDIHPEMRDGSECDFAFTKMSAAPYSAHGTATVALDCSRVALQDPCYAAVTCNADATVALAHQDGTNQIVVPKLFG